jgi:uncharacterized protein
MALRHSRVMNRRAHLMLLAAAGSAALVPRLASAGEHGMRIMVVGDSQAQGLAGGLLRLNRHARKYHILDHSKIATGLVSRATFNWSKEIDELIGADKPEVAVAMFGANDRLPIRIHGEIDPELEATFRTAYGEHVRDLVARIATAKVDLIWVGHPIVRDPAYSQDMTIINDIYAEAVRDVGGDWVSTWAMFADEQGAYEAHGKDLSGATVRLRTDDGVHLTPAGYDLLAERLQSHIEYYRLQREPLDSFPL